MKLILLEKLTEEVAPEQKLTPLIGFVIIPFGFAIVKKSSLLSNNKPETVVARTLQIVETGAEIVQL